MALILNEPILLTTTSNYGILNYRYSSKLKELEVTVGSDCPVALYHI